MFHRFFDRQTNWQLAVCFILSLSLLTSLGAGVEFPGTAPGPARARVEEDQLVLENDVVRVVWRTNGSDLRLRSMENLISGEKVTADSPAFQLFLYRTPNPAVTRITGLEMNLARTAELKRLPPNPSARRRADREQGYQLEARWSTGDGNLQICWQAVLRDGSNYVREVVEINASGEPVEIKDLVLLDLAAPGAQVVGSVFGSPVVAGNFFFGFEHPASSCRTTPGQGGAGTAFQCGYPAGIPLGVKEPVSYSAVLGVVPNGQLRRGFLYYVERERAQPYFVHLQHNNGEDIGMGHRKLEKTDPEAAARYRLDQHKMWTDLIHTYGRELINRRAVRMDSFVHDFKWDDEELVWQFHGGYPEGFTPMKAAAQSYGAKLGVWLTPWGRTGDPERTQFGFDKGFEGTPQLLFLSGPRYYLRFRNACVNMLRDYDLNYFKFDGIAGGNGAAGPKNYTSDIEALLKVIAELRRIKPDVFINPSTGSWPSPFWLWHGDAIWRAGGDAGEVGKGSARQKWITYRDQSTYTQTVLRGPLYPINSLMLHGIMINTGERVRTLDPKDIIDEIRSFFGTGTNLQELYVMPELLTEQTWDALAEGAKWARSRQDVLVDTHWVGGNPGKYEVYGWAAWSSNRGALTLRNPDDASQTIELDIAKIFELPEGAVRSYSLRSPWKEDASKPALKLAAGKPHRFVLAPFEVLVFDAEAAQ